MVRAVSVLLFQAMTMFSPRPFPGVSGARMIGRPLSNSAASAITCQSTQGCPNSRPITMRSNTRP